MPTTGPSNVGSSIVIEKVAVMDTFRWRAEDLGFYLWLDETATIRIRKRRWRGRRVS